MVIDIALFVLYLYVHVFVTWVLFVAIMHLKEHRKILAELHWSVRYFAAYPALAIGYFVDFTLQLAPATLFFLELPDYKNGHWMFTDRVQFHKYDENWRGKQARYWCNNFLDPFDKGHC